MKYLYFLILLFVFFSSKAQTASDTSINSSKAQPQIDEEHKIFTHSEIPVSYPTGEKKLLKYIENNINKKAIVENGAVKNDYTVIIRFIVRQDGTAYNFSPETKNGFGLEDETIRVLKTISQWEPAKQNNRRVYAYYRIKVSLSL